jgi:hypothetical protein
MADPPAIREAAVGILLWPSWGLYDSIKGDKFKHIDFSQDRVPFESSSVLPVRPASPAVLPLPLSCLGWEETGVMSAQRKRDQEPHSIRL